MQDRGAEELLKSILMEGNNVDLEDPRAWTRLFELIFDRDIFKPKGFLEKRALRGKVLDLSCGKGGLGIFLKKVNPEIELTGCDLLDYTDRGLVSAPYKQVVCQDALSFLEKTQEKEERYDFIISGGLPFKAIREIVTGVDFNKVLNPGGSVLFLSDDSLEEIPGIDQKQGYKLFKGNYPTDRSLLFYIQNT